MTLLIISYDIHLLAVENFKNLNPKTEFISLKFKLILKINALQNKNFNTKHFSFIRGNETVTYTVLFSKIYHTLISPHTGMQGIA